MQRLAVHHPKVSQQPTLVERLVDPDLHRTPPNVDAEIVERRRAGWGPAAAGSHRAGERGPGATSTACRCSGPLDGSTGERTSQTAGKLR